MVASGIKSGKQMGPGRRLRRFRWVACSYLPLSNEGVIKTMKLSVREPASGAASSQHCNQVVACRQGANNRSPISLLRHFVSGLGTQLRRADVFSVASSASICACTPLSRLKTTLQLHLIAVVRRVAGTGPRAATSIEATPK